MDNIVLIPVPLNEFLEAMKQQIAEMLDTKLPGYNFNFPENPLFSRPITEAELCKYLRISAPTAIRLRKKGKIPFISIGSAIRYNLSDVEKALQSKKLK